MTDLRAQKDIQAGFARRALYKAPCLPRKSFSSEDQRAEAAKQLAIGELLPLLPEVAISTLLDGAGTDMLTREEAIRALVAGLSHKAGTSGSSVVDVIKTLHFLHGYADERVEEGIAPGI